jgi:hypothetical protein
MAAGLALNAGTRRLKGYTPAALAGIRHALEAKTRDDPDFWSVVGLTELTVYEALAGRNLAGKRARIEAAYEDLHGKLNTPWMWKSVYDTARLVLPKYATRAPAAEKAAASALLNTLAKWAEP